MRRAKQVSVVLIFQVFGHALDQFEEVLAQLGIFDGIINADEFQRFLPLHDVSGAFEDGLVVFAETVRRCAACHIWGAFEEKADGDIENFAELIQARRTDTVCAVFIFLDLLKGYANLLGKLFLRKAE